MGAQTPQGHGAEVSKNQQKALEALCQTYWYPLYGYARRRGYGQQDAEDLTQGFFEFWLTKGCVDRATPQRGKFRAFLITSFKNYLHNDWEKSQARKRGGGSEILSLDLAKAELRFQFAAVPDDLQRGYDHDWATTVFAAALERLRNDYEASVRKQRVFDLLSPGLWSHGAPASGYAAMAKDLEMSEAAVKMAVSRMRQRFRALLREEVAQTLSDPSDLDAEIRYLAEVLSRHA